LKNFATNARKILLSGVANKIKTLGFDSNGIATEEPDVKQGGAIFLGDTVSEDFVEKWLSLRDAIKSKSLKTVIEEASYTWFNRLVAIRIMQKNGLIQPVLQYESDNVKIPFIVSEARNGRYPDMAEKTRAKLHTLLEDDSKTDEQFALLIVEYCHNEPMINKCFGKIADYTELLLPINILSQGGFVEMLNQSDYDVSKGEILITDSDYLSPELIGWLYQFYIADRKQEVYDSFKVGKKAEKDDIAPATQIFTPNWIVKYMVQNTIGRIYLDNNPGDPIQDKMEYLVETQPATEDTMLKIAEPEDITCADLACGSGHILNECFDILYDIYMSLWLQPAEAVENIFKLNLLGIDIDTRAKQLAQFALLLKACQKDSSFKDGHCMPRIYDMPDPYADKASLKANIQAFIQGADSNVINEIYDAVILMDQAKNLGSIMKFNISERTRNIISERMAEYEANDFNTQAVASLMPFMRIVLALTNKYSAIVMNPPYFGATNMNKVLWGYVQDNYSIGKTDLCIAMMLTQIRCTNNNGYYANIIPPSWMTIAAFEDLRLKIINTQSIKSLIDLSRGVFGADFGSTTCVIQNTINKNSTGVYFRLVERRFQEFNQKHLKVLFEKTLKDHCFKYKFSDYTKDVEDLDFSENGTKIYYPNIKQSNFEKIPSHSFGYWISEKMLNAFSTRHLPQICETRCGLATGRNEIFLRLWHEISLNKFGKDLRKDEVAISHKKWFPYDKAGEFRKWYGNQDYVLDWENNGKVLLTTMHPDGKRIWAHNFNLDKIYLPHIGWSDVCSGDLSFRDFGHGFNFDGSSNAVFCEDDEKRYNLLGYANSVIVKYVKKLLNPTIHFKPGNFLDLPYIDQEYIIEQAVVKNIQISKEDWDSHETSWNFEENELLKFDGVNLEKKVMNYQAHWTEQFNKLHSNEEFINNEFILAFGLEDELSKDVPLDEVTILQQGEISIADNQIVWHNDVVIKQFVSYLIGCCMGRYSNDKPGLILANQESKESDYYDIIDKSQDECAFRIDSDGIIPLMPADTDFKDNAVKQIKSLLVAMLGEDTLTENLNYIERCLGQSIEDYMMKDFWKNHKKMYQNRPIYWLFTSKKGAFQCIAYMHRMDKFTLTNLRNNYLLKYIEWLVVHKSELEAHSDTFTTKERKQYDLICKHIDECREYNERLQGLADQMIDFDLDDGILANYAKFGDVVQKLK